MSEASAASQVRAAEVIPQPPEQAIPPLMSLDDVKTWFGIADTTLDTQLTLAIEAVSQSIRNYTGRYLTRGSYQENFWQVDDQKPERYLQEVPVVVFDTVVNNGATLMNRNTGRVNIVAGQMVPVLYDGGYDPLPADLSVVFLDLVRQQMAAWGFEELGTAKPANVPQEKAVWLGTLKVEYAVNATSTQAKASGAGGISDAALAPYASVLDTYRSNRKLAAT